MSRVILVGVCLATASVGALHAAGQQTDAPEMAIKISTPIYMANGQIVGGSGTWRMQMNQPILAYPHGGSTFCGAGPAEDSGWRVSITPVGQSNGLVLQVDWQRVSNDGAALGQQVQALQPRPAENRAALRDLEAQLSAALGSRQHGHTQVTLQPGNHVMLDYISNSARVVSPNMATEVTRVTGRPPCDAVGMGLEISVESTPKAPTIIETDLWLIHTRPDKTEESQHQTLRVRAGDSAMYWFDAVLVQVSAATTIVSFSQGARANDQAGEPKPVAAVTVSGRLAPVDIGDGKIHMKLTIARSGAQGAQHTGIGRTTAAAIAIEPPTAGSATYDLTAEPGEVLSFQLPAIRGTGGYAPGATLSVRVRARILTPIPTTTTTTAPMTLNQR